MGVSFFMAFRKPVQPAVTGFMLWFSGHFSWCLMAHLPSNPVFIRVSGNVTVRRTQSHARKYTLFFPSVKVPAAIRVHSAMTYSIGQSVVLSIQPHSFRHTCRACCQKKTSTRGF